jgi:glycerol-3-phosphate dehydrogenase
MAEDAVDQAAHQAGLEFRSSVTENLKIAAPNEVPTITEPLHPDLPYTREDITRAVREEMAQTVEDVLARRTRALFLNAQAALETAPKVADIMANEMKKDREWIEAQLSEFGELVKSYMLN